MIAVRIFARQRRLVGAPEADQVRRNHAMPRGHQAWDHFAVEKRPGRLAMHQQNRCSVAGSLINVRNAQAIQIKVVGRKGEIGEPLKKSLWRSQDLRLVDRWQPSWQDRWQNCHRSGLLKPERK